eukprot:681795-Amphidinium_carterae.1
MLEAARNPLPSLPLDNTVTEPGGSVPAFPCQPLSRSSRHWTRWTAPGPGGSWCWPAAPLDCSLRYQLASSEVLCTLCCRSSRHWKGWTAPGPGGSWCWPAATLDCSLRYQLASAEELCNDWCKKLIISGSVLPPSKTPGLFPARHHF